MSEINDIFIDLRQNLLIVLVDHLLNIMKEFKNLEKK